jgi:hypothetical protein
MRCYFSLYVTGNTAVASRHCQLVSFHAYLPNIDSWLFHFQFFQLFLFDFVLEIKYFGYTTDILEMSTLKCFSSFIAISDTNHIGFFINISICLRLDNFVKRPLGNIWVNLLPQKHESICKARVKEDES